MKRMILSIAVALALSAAAVAPAPAQESSAAPDKLLETFGAWTLKCGANRANCHIAQGMYRTEDNKRLLQVTLFTPAAQNEQLFIRSLTPLGSVISSATVFIVDATEPKKVPFYSCWPRGCLAEAAVSRGFERAMRLGNKLAVQVKSAENGKTIRFELSLNGISKALDRLRELEGAG